MRNFREYDVWNNAISFIRKVYLLSPELPETEKYGIISQIKRSSVSISSNVAEGCSRTSERDFARFVEIAIGSAFETENLLIITMELGFISQDRINVLILELQVIQKQLISLYSKLKK
jgi:four helix bundle protein